ncbi:hypothetical protein [Amnibacterium endophyticum]|uniref:DUF308 domain-containing protein n=1 Tax=Amnibacterium endophyticum TaxID=2109337 RepID=A0ABW4LC59_9MICO
MTTTTGRTARRTPVAAPASRAVILAVLAAVVTFSTEHRPAYRVELGIVALGVFLLGQAVLLAAWSPRLASTRTGLALLVARASVSLLGAVLLLAAPGGGIDVLRPVQVLVFLVVGGLEVLGALLRAEGPDAFGDGIVIGGLQVVVGLMVVILDPDVAFSVGVLSAWAALSAVYLGIAAANLHVKRSRA